MASEFIGNGWAFPLRLDSTGRFATVSGTQELEEAMRLILATAPGERPMRPEFGCGIHDLVFSPASPALAARITHEVRVALTRWEPRIELLDVDVGFDAIEDGVLAIEIRYQPVRSNDPRNLVFPFYTLPEES